MSAGGRLHVLTYLRTLRNYLRAHRPILSHYALGTGMSYTGACPPSLLTQR